MSARSKARKRAVDLLFEAEARSLNAQSLLDERLDDPVRAGQDAHPVQDYTADVVRGVVAHWADIDSALTTYARGWTLDRMPAVDRAILRVATYELLWGDAPAGVAIKEAGDLAADLSTDDSPKFVVGLLNRIDEVRATLV